MTKYLQVGPATIRLQAPLMSKKLLHFLNPLLQDKKKNVNGVIKLRIGKQRQINLNRELKLLELITSDIKNLNNPFVKIGLLQALFRFANFCTQNKPYLLLHGSAASINNNKSILFGDNGKNLGKTSAAVELGLLSKKFIIDEFSFYDVEKNQILGYKWAPIHLRKDLIKHLNLKHKFNFETEECLVTPSKLGFKLPKENQLSMIIYPDYQPTKKAKLKHLTKQEARKEVKILSASHMVKFLNPQFDRMSWIRQDDFSDKTFNIREHCYQVAKKNAPYLEQINQKINSYEIIYNDFCQIPALVKQAIEQERKNIIEHRSASAVIYLIKKDKVKIILLKKKDGPWVLPKGHIEEGESTEEAVLREAKEEAGLSRGKIVKLLQKNFYTFEPSYGFAKHKKTVILYLVKADRISFEPMKYEGFEKVKAFNGEDAVKKAFYNSEKSAIKKALKIIRHNIEINE